MPGGRDLREDHPLRELLADLHREPNVLRLDLTGLDSADVVELLRGISDTPLGTADDRLAGALTATTNGNPFFITELVRGLAETGALVTGDGQLRLTDGADLGGEAPGEHHRDARRGACGACDGGTRRCLGVAAVLGEEFELRSAG